MGALASDANGIAQLALAAINGAAFTTLTASLKVGFLSVVRTTNNNTGTPDTEWTTSGGYTALGSSATGGAQPLTFAAATTDTTGAHQASNVVVSVTNAPAGNWAGNVVHDSAATNKVTWYGAITGGTKTINSGDTCTIASGSFTTNLG